MNLRSLLLLLGAALLIGVGIYAATAEHAHSPTTEVATGTPDSVAPAPSPTAVEGNAVPAANPGSAPVTSGAVVPRTSTRVSAAKEFVKPSGFLNIDTLSIRPNMNDVTMKDLLGRYVILLDFYTYTDLAFDRTSPYLNMWQGYYKDKGLIIVGIHAPRFTFERDKQNIQTAARARGIYYPIVIDNDKFTWNAYGNRTSPRMLLIDINGNIVYDHTGEGSYAEIETKIQQLLIERAKKLKKTVDVARLIEPPEGATTKGQSRVSDVYFGTLRNSVYLANGIAGKEGSQDITPPADTSKPDKIYLSGSWLFDKEFITPRTPDAKITYNYGARDVSMVLSAAKLTRVKVTLDGAPLGTRAGSDIRVEKGESVLYVSDSRQYHIVSDPAGYGEHRLEIVGDPGAQFYTFSF